MTCTIIGMAHQPDIVFLMSDQQSLGGEHLQEPARPDPGAAQRAHALFFLHVPLMIRPPDGFNAPPRQSSASATCASPNSISFCRLGTPSGAQPLAL